MTNQEEPKKREPGFLSDQEIRNMGGHPDAIPAIYLDWFVKGFRANMVENAVRESLSKNHFTENNSECISIPRIIRESPQKEELLSWLIAARNKEYELAKITDSNNSQSQTSHHIGAQQAFHQVIQKLQEVQLESIAPKEEQPELPVHEEKPESREDIMKAAEGFKYLRVFLYTEPQKSLWTACVDGLKLLIKNRKGGDTFTTKDVLYIMQCCFDAGIKTIEEVPPLSAVEPLTDEMIEREGKVRSDDKYHKILFIRTFIEGAKFARKKLRGN